MNISVDIRDAAVALARHAGYTVTRASNSLSAKRMQLINEQNVTTVLDVGANVGHYGELLRRAHYGGRIISFEPTMSAFEQLRATSAGDPRWDARHMALGDFDGTSKINVAAESVCSSLLPVTATSVQAAPQSAIVGSETITVRRLDSLADATTDDTMYIKLDVQGFELSVLRGACDTLPRVAAIECEVSFVPLYEGQPLAGTIFTELTHRGFDPVWIERGFVDPASGFMLQADVLFIRREMRPIA